MSYYISTNKQQCIDYNIAVSEEEKYINPTTGYAKVITHKSGVQFAILKHGKYPSEMEEIETLDGWFSDNEI